MRIQNSTDRQLTILTLEGPVAVAPGESESIDPAVVHLGRSDEGGVEVAVDGVGGVQTALGGGTGDDAGADIGTEGGDDDALSGLGGGTGDDAGADIGTEGGGGDGVGAPEFDLVNATGERVRVLSVSPLENGEPLAVSGAVGVLDVADPGGTLTVTLNPAE